MRAPAFRTNGGFSFGLTQKQARVCPIERFASAHTLRVPNSETSVLISSGGNFCNNIGTQRKCWSPTVMSALERSVGPPGSPGPVPAGEADVVVVGGGVAGATTARLLAEAGHRVIVLDKARFPRDKPCGEGVMPTGVRLLSRLGILARIPSGQSHPIQGICFVTRDAVEARGDFPDTGEGFQRGLGIRRLLLDQLVLEHARSHRGVEGHEEDAATAVVNSQPGR